MVTSTVIVSSSHLKGIGGHKKRMSSKMLKRRGIVGSHSRHESKTQISDDRLLRKAAHTTEISDTPMPVIDMGIEKITGLIHSVIDPKYEDAIQDAWEKILNDHPASEDAIIAIAKEVYKKHALNATNERYNTVSLDAPMRIQNEVSDATLKDILPAPIDRTDSEIEHDIQADTPQHRSVGRRHGDGRTVHVILDQETVAALEKDYPHEPLTKIVRRLAGVAPAENHRAWTMWEDAILKQRYPWGGSLAVKVDVARSLVAINQRANELHVVCKRQGKPTPDWFTDEEARVIFGVTCTTLLSWIRKGYLEQIAIDTGHNKGPSRFFTESQLASFISKHFLKLDEAKLDSRFHKYLPVNRGDWLTTKDVAKALGVTQACLVKHITLGELKATRGWLDRNYVNINEARAFMKQPYPVVSSGEPRTHYLFHTDEHNNQYLFCRKHQPEKIRYDTVEDQTHPPTCLTCLTALGIYRKQNGYVRAAESEYKASECIICDQPRSPNRSLCEFHADYYDRLNYYCWKDGCKEPRMKSFRLCQKHQDEQRINRERALRRQYGKVHVAKVKTKANRFPMRILHMISRLATGSQHHRSKWCAVRAATILRVATEYNHATKF